MHIVLSLVMILSTGGAFFASQKENTSHTASNTGRSEPSLRNVFRGHFEIGFGTGIPNAARSELVRHHASVVTCENDLKPHKLYAASENPVWKNADAWVDWVESLGLKPIGHTLVWPYKIPKWQREKIEAGELTKNDALAWQDAHIRRTLARYASRIQTWDVVNEALSDAPPAADPEADPLLRSDPWSDLCGIDYVIEAFRSARAAAPHAKLIYNDYLLEEPAKRKRLLRLLKVLENAGCPPDAIGIQGHYSLYSPSIQAIEEAIKEIHAAGYPIHITELDVSVYRQEGANLQVSDDTSRPPSQEVYEKLTPELQERLANRYRELFEVFLRHSDKIERVGFWNTDDGATWLKNWPVKGRPNYPLLFDANLMPKPAFYSILKLVHP